MTLWATLDAVSHQLELCGIGRASTVVALLGDDSSLNELVRSALARTGADALDVRPVPRAHDRRSLVERSALVADITTRADIIIDAGNPPHLSEPIVGVRILRLLPATAMADQYPPHANLAHRVASLERLLTAGSELRLTDPRGSDLRLKLDGARMHSDVGRPEPGHIESYPSGVTTITPAAGRVEGELIMMPGDANLSRRCHLRSPVRLELVDDRIVTIDGDNGDADTLRALFEGFDHHDPYGFGDLTLGSNAGTAGSPGPFDDRLIDPWLARCAIGTIGVSFGESLHADRPCPHRLDLVVSRRSLTIDGASVVDGGALQGELAPDVYEQPD